MQVQSLPAAASFPDLGACAGTLMSGLNRSRSGVCAQSFVKSVEAQAKDIVSSVSRLQDPTRPPSNRPPPSRLSLPNFPLPLALLLSLVPSPPLSPLSLFSLRLPSRGLRISYTICSLRMLTSGVAYRMRWDAACRL